MGASMNPNPVMRNPNPIIPSPAPGINFARNLLFAEGKRQIPWPQRPRNDDFFAG